MNTKLILVEGLPGSGKTTTAQLVNDILKEMNIETSLFFEGNLDHPADYDGVAYFTTAQFDSLLANNEPFKSLLHARVIKHGDDYFLPYQKLKIEFKSEWSDPLNHAISKNDIYELPFDLNKRLIVDNWRRFSEIALHTSEVYIFECCFIQNPVTVGMIKYGAADEAVINYVTELSAAVKQLNPLLIYVDQHDLAVSFKKAVKERAREWSDGFIHYYTEQGYGMKHGYQGLAGTIQVLEARQQLEMQIYQKLDMNKVRMDNSNMNQCKFELGTSKKITEQNGGNMRGES